MKVCLIGLGDIGIGYDIHNSDLFETHFSALSKNQVVDELYCIDIKYSGWMFGSRVYNNLKAIPEKLLVHTDLFVIATPTETHYSVLLELLSLPINHSAKFVVEKPLGCNLREAIKIRNLMVNREVFVNYIRRTSAFYAILEDLKVFDMMHSFNCSFEGDWKNIGSHFVDLYLFSTKNDKETHTLSENGVLQIARDNSRARFECVNFGKNTRSPYIIEIIGKNKKWICLEGGDTVNFVDIKKNLKTTVLNNGLRYYQKLFYDCLLDTGKISRLATISDAIEVHSILERINE